MCDHLNQLCFQPGVPTSLTHIHQHRSHLCPNRQQCTFLPPNPLSHPPFNPNQHSPTPTQTQSFPTMSTASHELRRRITSVNTAQKLIDSMLLIAASRIRYSSHAALSMRPFAERLQTLMSHLIQTIRTNGYDVEKASSKHRKDAFAILGGSTVLDIEAQKKLLDRMNIVMMDWNSYQQQQQQQRKKADESDGRLGEVGEEVNRICLVVISGDRGFCGNYNKSVILKTRNRIRDIQQKCGDNNYSIELICLGNIGSQYFKKHYPTIPQRLSISVANIFEANVIANRVCNEVLSSFIANEFDRVEFIYTRFVSILSNQISCRTLLPVSPSGIESLGDEVFQLTSRNGQLSTKAVGSSSDSNVLSNGGRGVEAMDTDQDPVLLLNAMLPMYVNSQVLRMLREGLAAELACRLSAMRSARDNAEAVQDQLKVKYHRERQAAITAQIIEVVSSANATPGFGYN